MFRVLLVSGHGAVNLNGMEWNEMGWDGNHCARYES